MSKNMIFWGLLPLCVSLVACASGSNNSELPTKEDSPPPVQETETDSQIATNTTDLPSSPPVAGETRQEILAQLYAQEESINLCQDFLDRDYSQNASQVFSLDEQTYLVQVGCFLAAYQANYEFFTYTLTDAGGEFTPLTLTVFNQTEAGDITESEVRNVAGLSTYSPATRSLNIFTKYRGIGDCGTLADYQLKDGKFELVKYQAKFDCDGNYVEPEEYPQIFP